MAGGRLEGEGLVLQGALQQEGSNEPCRRKYACSLNNFVLYIYVCKLTAFETCDIDVTMGNSAVTQLAGAPNKGPSGRTPANQHSLYPPARRGPYPSPFHSTITHTKALPRAPFPCTLTSNIAVQSPKPWRSTLFTSAALCTEVHTPYLPPFTHTHLKHRRPVAKPVFEHSFHQGSIMHRCPPGGQLLCSSCAPGLDVPGIWQLLLCGSECGQHLKPLLKP